jgi:glucosyl-dolichyl phosphate glucuronosyltransferase
MMGNNVRIAAIVPTHNRCHYLKGAIISLQRQDFPKDEYEIIVVDNNSTDKTPAVVEECSRSGGKKIVYVSEPALGLHNARHAGARRSRAEILAFTDDDAVYDPHWLAGLVRHYDEPAVGCVGGRILPLWEVDPPAWVDIIPNGFFSILDLGDEPLKLEYPGLYGVNFSIRKDILFRCGGFNPESFGAVWLGDGESGLLRKVLRAGYQVVYAPDAVCQHLVLKERLTLDYVRRRATNEGASASYCSFKQKRYGKLLLLGRSGALLLYAGFHDLMGRLSHAAGWQRQVYHHWRKAYGISRMKYEFRLVFDQKFRELVLTDDWLNCDDGLSPNIGNL